MLGWMDDGGGIIQKLLRGCDENRDWRKEEGRDEGPGSGEGGENQPPRKGMSGGRGINKIVQFVSSDDCR